MILRAYSIEHEIDIDSGLPVLLRQGLLTTIAMVRLLANGWCEPVSKSQLHASTLVQQIFSALAQYGGARPQGLWELLVKNGPFSAVTASQFGLLLQKLAESEIIFQDPTGLILLAPKGEAITQHYSFYAAFSTDDEYSIVSGNRTLGSMPISRPLSQGSFLIFAGRRWQVISISENERVVEVKPAGGGTLPGFEGTMGAALHGKVRKEMRAVLRSGEPVPFLDATGQEMLAEARAAYTRLELDENWLLQLGGDIHVLLWTGDRANDTLVLMLQACGLSASSEGLSVAIKDATLEEVHGVLRTICTEEIEPIQLAAGVQNKIREKWDSLLPCELLDASFASSSIDVSGARGALRSELDCGYPVQNVSDVTDSCRHSLPAREGCLQRRFSQVKDGHSPSNGINL
jgi:ATP-dependent Lhr-like helicase